MHQSPVGNWVVLAFTSANGEPAGPPQRCAVVAKFPFRLRSELVDEYPIVIARTRRAPGIKGGLGTGTSKYLHPAPTRKLTTIPIRSFMNPASQMSSHRSAFM